MAGTSRAPASTPAADRSRIRRTRTRYFRARTPAPRRVASGNRACSAFGTMGPSPHGPPARGPRRCAPGRARPSRGYAPPCTGRGRLDPIIAALTLALAVALIGALAGTAGFTALVVGRQNRRLAALAEHLTQAQDEGSLIALDANRIHDARLRQAFAALADR